MNFSGKKYIIRRANISLLIFFLLIFPQNSYAQVLQHLDASVENSIELDGSKVLKWKDLSGNGNDAVPGEGIVTISGFNWIDFGSDRNTLQLFSAASSDQWLDQSSGTEGFCVLLAFKVDSILDNWNDLIGTYSFLTKGFVSCLPVKLIASLTTGMT